MMSESWADDHGYRHIRCPKCGWSGTTDGDCENCSDEEGCEDCCSTNVDNCSCDKCECGQKFGKSERWCEACGEARVFETLHRSTVHVARKTYANAAHLAIFPGDTYRRTVVGGYTADGPRFLRVTRTLLKRAA